MTFIKPLLVSFSLLAFAAASVHAAGEAKEKRETKVQATQSQGKASGSAATGGSSAAGATKARSFTSLDTNKDGSIQRAEVAAHAELAAKFKDADKDNDGKLSRSEYDAMAKAGERPAAAGSSMKKDSK